MMKRVRWRRHHARADVADPWVILDAASRWATSEFSNRPSAQSRDVCASPELIRSTPGWSKQVHAHVVFGPGAHVRTRGREATLQRWLDWRTNLVSTGAG